MVVLDYYFFDRLKANRRTNVVSSLEGNLYTWGNWVSTPTLIFPGTVWSSVHSGRDFVFLMKSDKSLWGFGSNTFCQLGLGDVVYRSIPVLIDSGPWKCISPGNSHTVGIKLDGSLWEWGDFGQSSTDFKRTSIPTQVGSGTDWLEAYSGSYHSFSIKNDGSLWGWGSNSNGQLGLGNTTTSIPVLVSAGPWKKAACGYYHTVGQLASNTYPNIFATGGNWAGQLGIGNLIDKSTFSVNSYVTLKDISAGGNCSYGIDSNTRLYGWGDNTNGILGKAPIASPSYISTPTSITVGGVQKSWKSIVTNYGNTIATTTDDITYAWGANNVYQTGVGDTVHNTISTPTMLSNSSWISLGIGMVAAYGIK